MNNSDSAKKYHQIKNRLFFVNILVNILFLLFLSLSGLSIFLKNQILNFTQQFFLVNALYAFCFCIIFDAVGFPLSLYEGFILEHRFNLSNQRFTGWLKDFFKNAILGLVVILIAAEAVYIFLRKFPYHWWIWATFFWLFLTVVIAKITPSLIIPLFFKYRTLERAGLKTKLFVLLDKCGVKIKDIFYIDLSQKTKKANAFICGLGNNRRLVLSDTLLEKFSDEEVRGVVAHELGHYKDHDLFKMVLANTVASFFSFFLISIILEKLLRYFGFSRIDDIAFLPIFFLSIFLLGLVLLPILNAFNRNLERKADLFSLQLTADPDNFISMMKKLGELNLADLSPHRFIEILLYDHPPISKRIKLAEAFKKDV